MAESWAINASPTILLAKAGLMELVAKVGAFVKSLADAVKTI